MAAEGDLAEQLGVAVKLPLKQRIEALLNQVRASCRVCESQQQLLL